FIRKTRGETVYGLTCPLIVKADGKPFSKTAEGAIWLSKARTSPYRFYQFWFNTDDRDIVGYLNMFSFLNHDEIRNLAHSVETAPHLREAQKALAFELTSRLHGEQEAQRAVDASFALFGTEISGLDEELLLDVLQEAPSLSMSRSSLAGDGSGLVDVMVAAGLSPSKAAAKVDIEGGGVYINNVRAEGADRKIERDDLLHDRYVVLRRGKKTYHLLRYE
ncbi:MAG: tyrosine--tRNA ligase, partial [Actinobacteria bacterium]|nr:tyrosine--tRNA ligase [Actinomycetota bacterium]